MQTQPELHRNPSQTKSRISTRTVVTMAMLCAISLVVSYLCTFFPHVAGILKFDLKDTVIVIGGFLLGPVPAFFIAVVSSFIEMFTMSGTGPIGMIMLQLAKQAGASKVILSEPVEEKRAQALRLGVTKTIDPIHEDVAAVLSDYCENVNVVIECVGNVHTQEDAVHFAGKCATVMFFGLASPEDSFPLKPDEVFKKELHLTSSFINPYTFERAIAVLESGTIELGELITNEVPLDDIVDVFTKPEYRRTGKVMIRIS